jgi:DNA-binding transcriptional LysR family regulator
MDTSLKALRYFMTALKTGSITAAAKQMHVVPSAIFAAINQVEEAFGLQLTIRYRSKGIVPTATGKILLTRIQNLLDEYDELMNLGGEMRTQLNGTLRVGYYAPVAPAFLAKIARDILVDNPRVDIKFIECDTEQAEAGLLSGEFDVVLCVAQNTSPQNTSPQSTSPQSTSIGIAYETLIEMPPYLLVPEDHPFAKRQSVMMSELTAVPMVLLDLPVIRDYYRRLFDIAQIKPHIASTATTLEMVRSLVGAGVGCSLLHMRPKTQMTYAGHKIVELPFDDAAHSLKIVLGYFPDSPRRLVKYFVEDLKQLFSREDVNRLLVSKE